MCRRKPRLDRWFTDQAISKHARIAPWPPTQGFRIFGLQLASKAFQQRNTAVGEHAHPRHRSPECPESDLKRPNQHRYPNVSKPDDATNMIIGERSGT